MDTTVVITPRERFSILPRTLQSLFEHTSPDVPVLVIDAGTPEKIRRQLRELQKTRPFTHIESEGFVLPPRVRNMALDRVETKYVCYVDNDVFFEDGWLEALEQCAEREGAAAVCPVTLFGPLPRKTIHHAGSLLSVREDEAGNRLLHSEHRLEWKDFDEARARNWFDITMEHHEFEYHCVLIRADVLREIGGHDERQTHHDHINDSLRIRMLGHKIMLEPGSVVTSNALLPFTPDDWPYFLFRWSVPNTKRSEAMLGEVWGIRKNPVERQLQFVTMHRRRAMATTLPEWTRNLPEAVRERVLDVQQWRINRFDPKLPMPAEFRIPPRVPADGLRLAGITDA